jgi:hypothetical protein
MDIKAGVRQSFARALGLTEKPKPPRLAARGGVWFEQGDLKIHLGVEPDFRPAKKAHPALLVKRLDELIRRCEEAGAVAVWDKPGIGGPGNFNGDQPSYRLR